MHGSATAAAKQSAQERLAALIEPAILALRKALSHRDIHAVIKVARDLLDRNGLGAPARVDLRHRLDYDELVDATLNRPRTSEPTWTAPSSVLPSASASSSPSSRPSRPSLVTPASSTSLRTPAPAALSDEDDITERKPVDDWTALMRKQGAR